jgi:hypothetical protein
MDPEPCPRTPYLHEVGERFPNGPVRVEEKVDGADVALWRVGQRVEVMSRGGPGAMDRGRQLGRLRSWAAERHQALHRLCANGTVVYGERLWRTHAVYYDALPDWLAVLDLRQDGGWLDLRARDERAARAGLIVPPLVSAGLVVKDLGAAQRLIGASAWGSEPAEGIVLRRPDGARAKVVRSEFRQADDADWSGPARHNALRGRSRA